jgi:hypothetical protein
MLAQFDLYSYSSQTFWVIVCFFTFYFFISYYILTNLCYVFKMREKAQNLYSLGLKNSSILFDHNLSYFLKKNN